MSAAVSNSLKQRFTPTEKLEAIQKLDNPFKSLRDEDLLIAQRIKEMEDSKLYQQFIEICRIEDFELSLNVDVLCEKFRKLKLNYSIYLQTAKNNIQQLSEKIKTDEDKLPDALQKLTDDEQHRMLVQAEQTVKFESERRLDFNGCSAV